MIPSAGMPISLKDVYKVFKCFLFKKDPGKRVTEQIKSYLNVRYCHLTYMGRLGMYSALSALHKIHPDKNEVILSVLTCESVYYAIKRAGLKPILCDVEKKSVLISIEEITKKINDKTLCVIVNSMYGYIPEMDNIVKIVKDNNTFLIEDIAQSLGGEYKGKKVGSLGNISVLSFGKSKNISSVLGGAVCCNNPELSKEIEAIAKEFSKPKIKQKIKILIYFIISYFIAKPLIFGIITNFKKDFTTYDHEEEKPLMNMTRLQKSILNIKFNDLDSLNNIRKENAKRILGGIKNSNIEIIKISTAEGVYLRLPLICRNKEERDNYIEKLRNIGYWAMCNIFRPINKILEKEKNSYKNIDELDDRILILSTHSSLNQAEINNILKMINS